MIDRFYPRHVVLFAGIALAHCSIPVAAYDVSCEREDVREIRGSQAEYTIVVNGTADMDNTATRSHATWSIGFQNNRELSIVNTGSTPVKNPRIITNGRRKWHTVESMISEFTEGARDQQEAIYLIWEGLRQNRHHDSPLYGGMDYHDPVRLLNVYGGALCDDSSASGAALYHTAGFNEAAGGENPFQRGLHGHVMCEVWHDGDYQFMDIDQDTFFLDRENRKPVSGDALVRDHDLARRELAYGPLFTGWKRPIDNAALFGVDDVRTKYWSTGHSMDYTLRPGETDQLLLGPHRQNALEGAAAGAPVLRQLGAGLRTTIDGGATPEQRGEIGRNEPGRAWVCHP